MNIEYPERVSLAQLPTPLQPLDRITERYSKPYGGPRLWVKRDDLTESAMSGNKLRKLEFIIAEARATGCDTLITCGGEQSNHARATALAAAKAGLHAHLVLRGAATASNNAEVDGNLLVDHLAGASVSIYPLKQYINELPELFASWSAYYEERGHKALAVPTGGSDGLGIWGYIRAAEELMQDCAAAQIAPEHVICATGSGGTQAGLTLGAHLLGANTQITGYAVCDDRAYFVDKVSKDVADWKERYGKNIAPELLRIAVNDQYIGPGYGVADKAVYETIALAAQLEGILLDPVYTGKAFHGLLEEIKLGAYGGCRDIVFVHTGGQFGLFPHRAHFGSVRAMDE
ncbi:D-cysteine desulfhydrase family protein [uncultured Microbulbifer sp.]|uniref:D-cysteine desulfhydrase family protein n=1 Tax=uncultured Microbulbifer sp. TaxID=348147 RepID=UPI0025FDC7CC|nr:D-cysteine desulfhydrase family protein [uncultured Microbulbifer sp.]